MLTLFYNKLIYKHWLVKQFALDCDVINVLKYITYIIGKIRNLSQPPIEQIKDQINNSYLVYNDVIFKVSHSSQFLPRHYNSCAFAKGTILYDYTYELTTKCNFPHLYLSLEVDKQLSNMDEYKVIRTNNSMEIILY